MQKNLCIVIGIFCPHFSIYCCSLCPHLFCHRLWFTGIPREGLILDVLVLAKE